MASTQYQDVVPTSSQSNSTQQAGYLMQQQKAMQQSDARTAKRIKVEHGEETVSSPLQFNTPSPSPVPSSSITNGQPKANGQTKANYSTLQAARSSQQMGPPLISRPSATTGSISNNNGDAASPASASGAASPQPQGSRVNTGPGRVPYPIGMGLPTPGINFTRTPTTGSFVASNGNSRQHTPTDNAKTPSRASPSDVRTTQSTSMGGNAGSTSGAGGSRNTGVDQLQDLLSISGVDLRAEEEAAQRTTMARTSFNTANAAAISQASNPTQMRQSLFYLELYPLSRHIHRIASKHGLRVEPEVLTYLSLAAKTRFQNLLEAMIAASRHRNWSSHLRPPPLYERGGQAMYHEVIHDDPQKLLSALSKVEKLEEQESRQARIQKEELEASNANSGQTAEGGGVGGEGDSSGLTTTAEGGGEDGRKKAKKPGNSSTAKNMSEDKRLKLANKTAAQALGTSSNSKAWMFGGTLGGNSTFGSKKVKSGLAGGSRLPKPRFAPVTAAGNGDAEGQEGEGVGGEGGGEQQGESSQGGDGEQRSGSLSVGGWGDLAARKRLREEEERQARRSVNLQDALHALEMERSGGAGRGSGESMLYSTLALGKPPTRKL